MAGSSRKRCVCGRSLANVLMARFSAFGDVAMTVPVIYSACRSHAETHFVMVTRSSMVGIFVNAPSNLQVVGVDLREEYKGFRGMWRLMSELASERRFDAFVDLHGVLRTRVMGLYCRLHGIRVSRINKGRQNKRALTRKRNKVMLPLLSQRARYRAAFFHAGLPLSNRFDGLYGRDGKADSALFAAITAPKPEGERWVGIAPFAAHQGKIYPPELMEQVVARLDALPDVRVFMFGAGEREQSLLDGWAAKYRSSVSLAGKRYGFGAELALFSHLDCAVTMDSANMHLAAIAGTKTVSIWGATHPYCGFRGWRHREEDMVQLPLTCRPCSVFGDKPCYRGDYLCLSAIRPDVVFKKIVEDLNITDH